MLFKTSIVASAALALVLAACSEPAEEPAETPDEVMTEEPEATAPAPAAPDYPGLLAMETRPEGDAADDAARKPDQVIAFAGVEPGMTVLELEAGGGYYTELLSYAVGPDGSVYMQNPAEFDAFLGDSVTNRLADDRLANVSYVKSDFDDLDVPDGSVDVVTWILGPHELWFFPENKPDGFGDPAATYDEIVRVLKPGGVFLALDHAAAEGSPETTGGSTHRIDPAIIIDLAETAGLELVGETDILANPDDDYTKGVFDPAVRRKTDRFVLKFEKP